MTLVGAGQNARYNIATHLGMTLGDFKDDAMQSHTHSYETWSDRSADGDNSDNYARYSSTGNTGDASGRTDTTTHGKIVAVNWIIKGK